MGWWAVVLWLVLLALPWIALIRHAIRKREQLHRYSAEDSVPALTRITQQRDAGMQLIEKDQWSEAMAAFDRGLGLLQDDPDPRLEVELLFYRGFGLEQLGKLEEATSSYADCQTIYGRLHHELQYAAAVRQGILLARLKRNSEAEHHLLRTITALQRAPESVSWLQVEAHQILAGLFYRVPDYTRAVACVQQGARAAHGLHNAAAEASFLQAAGDGLRLLGRLDEALHNYERSLDLYRRIGEGREEAVVKRNISLIHQSAGHWDKSLAWLQACLLDEEREQNKGGQAMLCYDMACLHIDQGNLQDAGSLLQRSMSLFRQTEDRQGLDEVGRTLMGLSILVHRRMTGSRMTFRDIERGTKSKKEDE
jgi:tetratricopeptide (TPR) repeat protein